MSGDGGGMGSEGSSVTDADIKAILDENIPGVSVVVEAFDKFDRAYAAAAAQGYPAITYGSFTVPL